MGRSYSPEGEPPSTPKDLRQRQPVRSPSRTYLISYFHRLNATRYSIAQPVSLLTPSHCLLIRWANKVVTRDEPHAEREKQQHLPEALPVFWKAVNECDNANEAEKQRPRNSESPEMRQ